MSSEELGHAQELFSAHRVSEDETLAMMANVLETTGELVDPHTAVGLCAAAAARSETEAPIVTLATAHPAKFPDAVRRATGVDPVLPLHLQGLMKKPERLTTLPNSLAAVQSHIDQLADPTS